MTNHHTYDIYYDEEGDFLEITRDAPPEHSYAEEVEEGVFIRRAEKTDNVVGIGILSFKKRATKLRRLLQKWKLVLPLDIVLPYE